MASRILAIVLGLSVCLPATAEIFQWSDAAGGIHFTRDLHEVPPPQRAAARERASQREPSRLQTYDQADAPPASIAPARRRMGLRGELRIPFRRQGTLMVVDVTLNDVVTAPFLVDTGASAIAIPAAMLDDLGIHLDPSAPRLPVQTAGGVVEEPIVRLDSVQLGGARVEQLDALVSSSMQVGLLGGNFFNNFVYQVDTAAGEITLRANDQMRSGLSADQWRARFARLEDGLARLDAHLADQRPEEAGVFRANRARLAVALEDLRREANSAGVPQSWR